MNRCIDCGIEIEGTKNKKRCYECQKENARILAKIARKKMRKNKNEKRENINKMIGEEIKYQFKIRYDRMNEIRHFTMQDLIYQVNLNSASVYSVKTGHCQLPMYQKVIGKMDQIISLL